MDILITILAIHTVSLIAFFFGRNPFRWSIYAYVFDFWVLIPLFLLKRYSKPPVSSTIIKLAEEINLRRQLRKIKTPEDLKKELF
jgi:hypothetical protein